MSYEAIVRNFSAKTAQRKQAAAEAAAKQNAPEADEAAEADEAPKKKRTSSRWTVGSISASVDVTEEKGTGNETSTSKRKGKKTAKASASSDDAQSSSSTNECETKDKVKKKTKKTAKASDSSGKKSTTSAKGKIKKTKKKVKAPEEKQQQASPTTYLTPKIQPIQKDDGTYEKPRGRPPRGYEWDKYKGIWMSVFDQDDNNEITKGQENKELVKKQQRGVINSAESSGGEEKVMMDDENDHNNEIEEEEQWDLIKVMTITALESDSPIECSTETCSLPAACVYVSNLAPKDKWYTCLDCQENDFGGWPEELSEFPIQSMTKKHKVALMTHCSRTKNIPMPVFFDEQQQQDADVGIADDDDDDDDVVRRCDGEVGDVDGDIVVHDEVMATVGGLPLTAPGKPPKDTSSPSFLSPVATGVTAGLSNMTVPAIIPSPAFVGAVTHGTAVGSSSAGGGKTSGEPNEAAAPRKKSTKKKKAAEAPASSAVEKKKAKAPVTVKQEGTRQGVMKHNRSEDHEVQFISKRPRKELDLHLQQEMESNLEYAWDNAKEGNRSMMEFGLRRAKKHATNAGSMGDFKIREHLIRQKLSLSDERGFHLRKMESFLGYAWVCGKKQDRSMTDYNLGQAKKHATSAGSVDKFKIREQEIRYKLNLGDEREFHLRMMERNLGHAWDHAKEGDGNKNLMNVWLDQAKYHATSAGSIGEYERERISIEAVFYGTKTIQKSKETKCKIDSNGDASPEQALLETNLTTKLETATREVTPHKDNTKEDEVVTEKELNVTGVIANRVKEAESRGEIINVD